MNILYVVPFANIRVKQFVKYLERLGNKVYVIDVSPCWVAESALDEGKFFAGDEILNNLTYIRPPIRFKLLPLKVLFSIPRIIWTIRTLIKLHQISIVISYNPAIYTALPAWIAKLGTKIPLAIYYMEVFAYDETGMRFRRILERFIINHVNIMLVVTQVMKEYIATHFKVPINNIYVFRLAADLEEYDPSLIDIEKYRNKYKIQPSDRVIVNAGTTNMVKTRQGWVDFQDMSTIIQAIPIILQKYPKIKLILLGLENDKTVVQLIEKLNLQKYIILGSKFKFWKAEHLSTLAIADCLCLPTIDVLATRYYCKYKVLDYMLAKKPIITADTPGLKETFRDSALYYKPENPESFADQVNYCFEHPEEMQKKAEQVYQLLISEHLWEHESKRLNDFLHNHIGN